MLSTMSASFRTHVSFFQILPLLTEKKKEGKRRRDPGGPLGNTGEVLTWPAGKHFGEILGVLIYAY
jgi:hypothetical protein